MQRVNGEKEAGQAEEDAEELAATCAGAHLCKDLLWKWNYFIQRNKANLGEGTKIMITK